MIQSNTKKLRILKLDISKAIFELGWKPVLSFSETIKFTVEGYLSDVNNLSPSFEDRVNTIKKYIEIANNQNIKWIGK